MAELMPVRFKIFVGGKPAGEIVVGPAPGYSRADRDTSFLKWALETMQGEPMAEETHEFEIVPVVDVDGVPWCKAPEGAESHPCPAWRLQRCAAGGRPWGICSPMVRRMAHTIEALSASLPVEETRKPLPCGHEPDTFRRHMAICSKCEPDDEQ